MQTIVNCANLRSRCRCTDRLVVRAFRRDSPLIDFTTSDDMDNLDRHVAEKMTSFGNQYEQEDSSLFGSTDSNTSSDTCSASHASSEDELHPKTGGDDSNESDEDSHGGAEASGQSHFDVIEEEPLQGREDPGVEGELVVESKDTADGEQTPVPTSQQVSSQTSHLTSHQASSQSSLVSTASSRSTKSKSVRFDALHIREYAITLGDHPSVNCGPPVTIEWEYSASYKLDVQQYEEAFEKGTMMRRKSVELKLPADVRTSMLSESNTARQMFRAHQEARTVQTQRRFSAASSDFEEWQEAWQCLARKWRKWRKHRAGIVAEPAEVWIEQYKQRRSSSGSNENESIRKRTMIATVNARKAAIQSRRSSIQDVVVPSAK